MAWRSPASTGVAGGGNGAVDGAAASCFAAGIAARLPGQVLWCVTQADLFAPGLEQAGLGPDQMIYAEAGVRFEMAGFQVVLGHDALRVAQPLPRGNAAKGQPRHASGFASHV